jgi:hypothetical protein
MTRTLDSDDTPIRGIMYGHVSIGSKVNKGVWRLHIAFNLFLNLLCARCFEKVERRV